jgi:hypothetical protein
VDRKTQKYFLNYQQEKITNQTENQPNSMKKHEKNNDFHEKLTPNVILDISAILKKIQKQKHGLSEVCGQYFSVCHLEKLCCVG